MKILFTLEDRKINNLDKNIFNKILSHLRSENLDTDRVSSSELSRILKTPPNLSAENFAREVFYVILASGFSQQTAIKKWREIISEIETNGARYDNLIKIFGNKTKINSIINVWENRKSFRDGFYQLRNENRSKEEQVDYLETIPYIGKTTKNHLARNLGISIVKYDVWIQRLGIVLNNSNLSKSQIEKQIKFPVSKQVQENCDKIFEELEASTNESIGFIDVILWKACQLGILKVVE